MLNVSINVGVQCCVCLVAVVGLRAACFDGGGESDLETIDTLKAIMGTRRLPTTDRYPGGVDLKRDAAEVTLPTSLSRRPKLADGFFGAHGHRRPAGKKQKPGRHRVTCNYTKATDDGENRKTNHGYDSTTNMLTAITIATSPGRIVFDNENECVLANNGRPCVCYTTDFLDLLSRRLDGTTADSQAMSQCPSFKALPAAFVVSPITVTRAVVNDHMVTTANISELKIPINKSSGDENKDIIAVVRKEVDFDYVVEYHLQTPKDDFKAIQYGLVGSDVRIRCLVNSDVNSTGINTFRWDYKKGKYKTNSTVTGVDTSNLLILGLEPGDSKNYTCIPYTGAIRNSKYSTSYTHYVVAVDKPIYEIHGTATYKTNSGGGCTSEIINNVRKQLPSSIQSELCPEGLSRYACNVNVETSKCIENERDVSPYVYYLTAFLWLSVCIVLLAACLCCCRDEKETKIRIIPKKIRRQFKKTKKKSYDVLSDGQTSEDTETEDRKTNEDHRSKSYKYKTLNTTKDITLKSTKDSTRKCKFEKLPKSKSKIMQRSEIPFNSVHEKIGQCIREELVSK